MTRPLDTRVGSPGRVLPGSGVLDPDGAALIDRLHTIAQTCDLVARMQGLSAARKLWLDLGGPVLPLDGEATDAAGRPAALRTSMPDQGRGAGAVSFDFDGRPVRTVLIDGMVWFVGQDVAERLGYVHGASAMKRHCKGARKLHPLATSRGSQKVRVLSEADVLRLMVASKLPEAERWVFEVALPELRLMEQFAGGGCGVRGASTLRTSETATPPRRVTLSDVDWIARFIDECCEMDGSSMVAAMAFRKGYRSWAASVRAPALADQAIGRYVVRLGIARRRSGGSHYVGLRLKPLSSSRRSC